MLKDHQDALGHALFDYLNGISSYEITERDDGFIQSEIGPKGYFRPYSEWSSIEKKASKLVKGRILDVGCGAGRHALYFQEKEYEVLGIDVEKKRLSLSIKNIDAAMEKEELDRVLNDASSKRVTLGDFIKIKLKE